MELDCWCTCGKQIYDPNALYCSKECANADNVQNPSTKAVPQTPPVNLHFSITITPNIYRASDSNAKVLSSPLSTSSSGSSFTSIYTHDQNFNDNYDYVYTSNHHRNCEEMVNVIPTTPLAIR